MYSFPGAKALRTQGEKEKAMRDLGYRLLVRLWEREKYTVVIYPLFCNCLFYCFVVHFTGHTLE